MSWWSLWSNSRRYAAANPGTSANRLGALADGDVDVRRLVASNPSTPTQFLVVLARDEDAQTRQAAVSQYWASRSQAEGLSPNRLAAAKDQETPADALQVLANDQDPHVRRAVADNSTTPAETRLALADDQDQSVRSAAAHRIRFFDGELAPETLAAFARSQHEFARAAAAERASVEMLRILARDKGEAVRLAVACNSSTPVEVLTALADDHEAEVRGTAVRKIIWAATLARGVDTAVIRTLARCQYASSRQAVAASSAAPEEVLRGLAHDGDTLVRQAVASNVRTPKEALAALADDPEKSVRACVAKLAENAHRAQWRRGSPDELSSDVLRTLAAVQNVDVRYWVAGNYKLPADSLVALTNDRDERLRSQVTRALHTAKLDTAALAILSQSPDENLRASVAGRNDTPPQILLTLADDRSATVRSTVAGNSSTPSETLVTLAHDGDESVSETALKSVKAAIGKDRFTAEDLTRLASHRSDMVRMTVAGDPATPPEVLKELADDGAHDVRRAVVDAVTSGKLDVAALPLLACALTSEVRKAVALNSATSEAVLRDLANDIDEGVRVAVARNGYTFATALFQTLDTSDSSMLQGVAAIHNQKAPVLAEIARDPAAPEATMRAFAGSPYPVVRHAVADNVNSPAPLLANLARDTHPDVRKAVACNPNTTPEALSVLARDQHPEVRKAIASNPNTTPVTLRDMTQDPDENVAVALAQNPNLSERALRDLLRLHSAPTREASMAALSLAFPAGSLERDILTWHQGVRQAIAASPRTPDDLLAALAEAPDTVRTVAGNTATPADALRDLAYHRDAAVRQALAINPRTPTETLGVLALDEEEEVRANAALNPHLPEALRKTLAHDRSSVVSRAASATPTTGDATP